MERKQFHQSIPDYFAKKCVFITGATGFMGKVLVEKLLRSCPNIGNIYILVRSKKDISPQDRWKKIVEDELFDKLKEENQLALNKIIIIEGDSNELGLGISAKDREEIINNVSIVYHSAATVRFFEPLKKAILLNVRGTREICKLVLEIKNLLIFMHVSTCYCQVGSEPLEEKLYPARSDPYKAIEIAETMDAETLKQITLKYIQGFPNTYTFTKNLSETLVKNMCEGKVPTIVYRPSIVTPTVIDPIPGWVDNLNGSLSACIGSIKGIIRTLRFNPKSNLDYCPVDAVIRGMIKATCYQTHIENNNITVYNCSSINCIDFTVEDHQKTADLLMSRKLWCKPLLEYNISITTSTFVFWMRLYWYQFLPAMFVDIILKLLGKKPLVLKILTKIVVAINSNSYFATKNWYFINKKFIGLDKYLLNEDEDAFSNCMDCFDDEEYMIASTSKICRMINDGDLHENYKSMKRRSYIYFVWNNVWRMIFAFAFYKYILLPLWNTCMDYLISL